MNEITTIDVLKIIGNMAHRMRDVEEWKIKHIVGAS